MKIIAVTPDVDIRTIKFLEQFNKCESEIVWISEKKTRKNWDERIAQLKYLVVHKVISKSILPTQLIHNPIRDKTLKKLLKVNFDLVYVREMFLAYVLIKRFKIPKEKIILDIADDYLAVLENSNSLSKKIFRNIYNLKKIESTVLLNSGKILFVCNEAKDEILERNKLINLSNYFIIANAPTKKSFNKSFSQIESISNNILYVGTIDKGIRDFDVIMGLKNVVKKHIKIDCYSFDITNNLYIKEIEEYFNDSKFLKINFKEAVNNEKYEELLRSYKFGIIPHKRNKITDNTIPNKIYDYFNCELFVISSNNPAIISEFKDNENIKFYKGEDEHSLYQVLNEIDFDKMTSKNSKKYYFETYFDAMWLKI